MNKINKSQYCAVIILFGALRKEFETMLHILYLTANGLSDKSRAFLFAFGNNQTKASVNDAQWKKARNTKIRKKTNSFYIRSFSGTGDILPSPDREAGKNCIAICIYSEVYKGNDKNYVLCVISEKDGSICLDYLFYKVQMLSLEKALECLNKFLSGVGVDFAWFANNFKVSDVSIYSFSEKGFPFFDLDVGSDLGRIFIHSLCETNTKETVCKNMLVRLGYLHPVFLREFIAQKMYEREMLSSLGGFVSSTIGALQSIKVSGKDFYSFRNNELPTMFKED